MSILVYGDTTQGNAGVYLNVVQILHYKVEPVYAGPDHIANRIQLGCRCVWNPGSQQEEVGVPLTWNQLPPHTVPPVPAARQPPVGTLSSRKMPPHSGTPDYRYPAVRSLPAGLFSLTQPRLRLHWAYENQTVLVTPIPGFVCDDDPDQPGPIPLKVEVVEAGNFLSGKSWLVDVYFQTTLADGPRVTDKPSPVLAHTWSQEDTLDPDYFVVRVTQGTTVFSPSLVRTPNALTNLLGNVEVPVDLFRPWLFPTVQKGMKREQIKVKVRAGGHIVDWMCQDREVALSLVPSGITRVEINHKTINALPDITIGVPVKGLGTVGLSPWMLAVRANAADAAAGGWLKWLVGGPLAGMGMPMGMTDARLRSFLTTSRHILQVRCWGHKNVTRNQLEQIARDITTTRVAPVRVGVSGICLSEEIEHDAAAVFVACTSIYIAGPLKPLNSVLPNRTATDVLVFGPNNETAGLLSLSSIVQTQLPTLDSISRSSSFIETLVTSALTAPHDKRNIPFPAPLTNSLPAITTPGSNPGTDYITTPPTWPRPAS